MARYRKISVCIWNDAKFNGLSDDGKLAFIFVLTHPHMTALGAMRATIPGLACELGWPTERLREAFEKASREGIIKYDKRASCVFLPNFVKHNPPESPNVVIAWAKCLEEIPECCLKTQAIQAAILVAESLSEAFRKPLGSLREAFAKSMPNQEQEQEQDKEEPSLRSGSCPEVVEPPSGHVPEELPKLVGTLPLADGSDFEVRQNLVDELAPLFPGVDVVNEMRRMKAWLLAKPKRKKTKRGVRAFITGWLDKEQNERGGRKDSGASPHAPCLQPRTYQEQQREEQRETARSLIQTYKIQGFGDGIDQADSVGSHEVFQHEASELPAKIERGIGCP